MGTPFVCVQAGELYLWSSKDVQSNTEYDKDWIYRTHIIPEGSQPLLCPTAAWLWLSRGICMALSTDISTYTFLSLQNFSQRRLLSRKAEPRQFLKKPQPCDGFKHNSKATNTTTVGSSCQSTRCCCWKNSSAAMGSGLPCHQRQRRRRRREQELWAPALLVQKERKVGQKETSSLIKVGKSFAVSSMISTNGYVKQRAAADHS